MRRSLALLCVTVLVACAPTVAPPAPGSPTPPRRGGPFTRIILDAPVDPGHDLDCADFADQASAERHLRADPRDPDHLDADKDGVACEKLLRPRR